MRTRPIFVATAMSIAMLIAINVAMVPWSKRLPYRRKLDAIKQTRDADIVFVGDSLLDTRLNVDALNRGAAKEGTSFTPVNAALGATLPPDHALLVDYATQWNPHIKMMVVGVMDFLVTSNVHFRPIDLTGNHNIGVFSEFPVAKVSEVNQWDRLDQMQLRLLRVFPMFANRMNAWQYIEKLRRVLGQVGLPPEKTNEFGRVADMFALEAKSGTDFDERAQQFLNNPQFNSSYEAIFATAQQKQMKVVLLVMPMSSYHRAQFYSRDSWHEYLGKLKELAAQRGFTVIDASEWMPAPADFTDNVHLSKTGSVGFSQELGERLALLKRK